MQVSAGKRLASVQAEAVSILIVQWALAHGFIASSSVEFKARTANVKSAVLWTNRNISAVSALFMLAKLTLASFARTAGGHKSRLTMALRGFLRGQTILWSGCDQREGRKR